jgi:hypothetical protein
VSYSPTSDIPALAQCQLCKQTRATRFVSFHRNVGMLFARKSYALHGNLCESCINKMFWQFTGKNILLGPWGIISLVVTPFYLLQNTGVYLKALYKLRGTPQ